MRTANNRVTDANKLVMVVIQAISGRTIGDTNTCSPREAQMQTFQDSLSVVSSAGNVYSDPSPHSHDKKRIGIKTK